MPSQNGNDGQGGPWDRGARPTSDIEDIIRLAQDRLRQMMPRGGLRGVIVVAVIAAIGLGAWTAYYTVPSDSVAVVQRFGKYLKEVPPGLHFKLPLGIDAATIVPVKRQLKQEFGFATPGANDPYQSSHSRDGERETQMVTGDLNAALVEWVVQYRISDPVKFLFEVREPSETLRYVSESVMREVVGDRTVDEVITIGRQEIESEALTKMQALSTKYAMGISIDQVQLKNINPPKPVQESFNEVNQAQQEKEKLINEARRDYNKVIPLAEGEKDRSWPPSPIDASTALISTRPLTAVGVAFPGFHVGIGDAGFALQMHGYSSGTRHFQEVASIFVRPSAFSGSITPARKTVQEQFCEHELQAFVGAIDFARSRRVPR